MRSIFHADDSEARFEPHDLMTSFHLQPPIVVPRSRVECDGLRLGDVPETTLIFIMVEHAVTQDAGLATVDLHRSNLLRLQVAQLLEECQLDLDSKKWRVETEEYIQLISKIVSKVDAKKTNFQERADKPISVEVVPSDDGLSVIVMGCTKNRLFMTNKAGNAQVLPTFELMVQIPECSFSGKDFISYRYFDVSSTAGLLRKCLA
jgi:hypothetical protein